MVMISEVRAGGTTPVEVVGHHLERFKEPLVVVVLVWGRRKLALPLGLSDRRCTTSSSILVSVLRVSAM